MGKRSIWNRGFVALVLAAGFQVGVAKAQDQRGQADIQGDRTANLSGPEQMTEARHIIEVIGNIRRTVSDMLDRARQERDIIKVNCLDDKLTQIDVAQRSANDHQSLLENAVSISNDGLRNHEFNLMTIFRQRVSGLEAEARQCVGEDVGGFGDGLVVSVTVDPRIPEEETAPYPRDPNELPDQPPVVSPVR